MKLHVDREAVALCLRFDDSTISGSEEVSPGVALDDNEAREVVTTKSKPKSVDCGIVEFLSQVLA